LIIFEEIVGMGRSVIAVVRVQWKVAAVVAEPLVRFNISLTTALVMFGAKSLPVVLAGFTVTSLESF
jgi:hypothetical protein